MVDAGELAEFVDSGNVSLVNATDNLTFKQLRRVRPSVKANVIPKQTISNVLDNRFDLRNFWIDAQIWLTEPEITTWVGWTVQTLNLPDPHSWQVKFTGDDGTTSTLSGTFRLSDLSWNSEEEGYSVYDIKLVSVDGVPTES